jgi:hypothetical protein
VRYFKHCDSEHISNTATLSIYEPRFVFVRPCVDLRAFQDIAYLKWACDELRNGKNTEWARDGESGDLGALWHGSSDLWGREDTMFRESFSRALDSLCILSDLVICAPGKAGEMKLAVFRPSCYGLVTALQY